MRSSLSINFTLALFLALALSACSDPTSTPDITLDEPGTITQGDAPSVSYGAIAGEDGMSVNGIVVLHHTGESTGNVTFQINIQPAAAGYHYQAWIENTQTGARQEIGTLESATNDERHAIRAESTTSLAGFNGAYITLQTDGSSDLGKVVARGNLQPSGQ